MNGDGRFADLHDVAVADLPLLDDLPVYLGAIGRIEVADAQALGGFFDHAVVAAGHAVGQDDDIGGMPADGDRFIGDSDFACAVGGLDLQIGLRHRDENSTNNPRARSTPDGYRTIVS